MIFIVAALYLFLLFFIVWDLHSEAYFNTWEEILNRNSASWRNTIDLFISGKISHEEMCYRVAVNELSYVMWLKAYTGR